MDDKFNTAAGWVLGAGIVALGASIVSGMYFKADSHEELETYGYFIDAPEEGAGAAGEMSIEEALNTEGVDAAAGEKIFAKCTACHTINQGGANGIGPNLYGIMGKAVGGGAAGFAYSSDLANHGGSWDWQTMSDWLKSPKAFAPGTKMSFAGLGKVEDRAAIMLYLNSQGSSLPVPEFVPEAAPEEGVDGAGEGPGVTEGEDADTVEAAGAMGDEQPVPTDQPATAN